MQRRDDKPDQTKSGGAAQQQDQSTKPHDPRDRTKPGSEPHNEPIQQHLYKPRRRPKQVQA